MKFVETKIVSKLIELADKKAPVPPEIAELKNRIEVATKVAEMEEASGKRPSREVVNAIVSMKLQLDGAYARWAESECV
jgi:hypothetical protein